MEKNNSTYFTSPNTLKNNCELQKRLEKVEKILSKYSAESSLEEFDLEDISDALYELEVSSYSLRMSLENCENHEQNLTGGDVDFLEFAFKNLPISVEFDGKSLVVTSPFLLPNKRQNLNKKREIMKAFTFPNLLKLCLKKVQNDEQLYQKILRHFSENELEIICVQLRNEKSDYVVCGEKYYQSPIDLDNLEFSNCVNNLFSFLCRSDNPFDMTDIHFAQRYESDDARKGTVVYLLRKEDEEEYMKKVNEYGKENVYKK